MDDVNSRNTGLVKRRSVLNEKSIDEIFSTLQIISKNNKIFLDLKNELNENFNIERFDDKIKLNLSSLN